MRTRSTNILIIKKGGRENEIRSYLSRTNGEGNAINRSDYKQSVIGQRNAHLPKTVGTTSSPLHGYEMMKQNARKKK